MPYVLRSKDYKKGDRFAFHEYIIFNCERTGKVLSPPESNWERLKYAEIFDNKEEAERDKLIVDSMDELLEVVCLRVAEEEY